MTQTPKTSRRGIGGNAPPLVVLTMQDCEDLAKTAFGEVDQIEKLNQTSVQEMAAAAMGYHSNLTRPPELGYYTMSNQVKAHDAIWTSMFDFFLPKEVRAKNPAQGKPDLDAEKAWDIYKRRRALLERGVELASWLARCHMTLDNYKTEAGLWEVPLHCFCKEGYNAEAEEDVKTTLMDGTRWFATRKARKATKTQPAVTSDLDKFNASVNQFLEVQKEKAKPKLVTPTIVPDTAKPNPGPLTPITPPIAGAPSVPVNGANGDNREPRLPATEAATQTISGWCNAVIKTLRATDNGKLAYRTLKDLADPDREALVMLVKIYDEMVKLAADAKAKPTMRAEKIAA